MLYLPAPPQQQQTALDCDQYFAAPALPLQLQDSSQEWVRAGDIHTGPSAAGTTATVEAKDAVDAIPNEDVHAFALGVGHSAGPAVACQEWVLHHAIGSSSLDSETGGKK